MNWLLKTEPSDYSFDDLVGDGRTVWSGVSNAVALKNLRAMARGDKLLIYHTGKEKAIVGLATVAKAAYPDPKEKDPRLVVVEVAAGKMLPHPVTLAQIKATPLLKEWQLLKIGRLSVVPTTQEQFDAVFRLAKAGE